MAKVVKEGIVVSGKRVSENDVTFPDFEGRPVRIGSIVEIVERGRDYYKGLYYVVGFEADSGRGMRFLLARCRWDKWEIKIAPARAELKAY